MIDLFRKPNLLGVLDWRRTGHRRGGDLGSIWVRGKDGTVFRAKVEQFLAPEVVQAKDALEGGLLSGSWAHVPGWCSLYIPDSTSARILAM